MLFEERRASWNISLRIFSQEPIEKRGRDNQRDARRQSETERGAEQARRGAKNDGTDGAHTLVHVEDAHHPPQQFARRFDLNDHPADRAEAYLARADQSEQNNRNPKQRREAK